MNPIEIIDALYAELKHKSPENGLSYIAGKFPGTTTFSTSFGLEDQVITDMLSKQKLPVEVFTLDTGRLFPETYSTWSSTLDRYKLPIKAWYPSDEELKQWIEENGPNGFYNSPEQRKACCYIRKVLPLKKALTGKKIWITGLRAEQSPNRKSQTLIEWDEGNEIIKYHPLLHWSWKEVKDYVKTHQVPNNPLHDRGFLSIGCAPCTRAIKDGEDFRAGRWWWEDNSKKECGLHSN